MYGLSQLEEWTGICGSSAALLFGCCGETRMNHLFGCESRLERNESHQGCACQCHRPTFAEKYHMVDQSIGQPIGKVERCTALEMPEYPRSRTNRQCRLAAHHQGL